MCCCVEKAALHIEVVTVEMKVVKGRKVKTKREGLVLVPSSQARNAVCVFYSCLLIVVIHSLYEYRSP